MCVCWWGVLGECFLNSNCPKNKIDSVRPGTPIL